MRQENILSMRSRSVKEDANDVAVANVPSGRFQYRRLPIGSIAGKRETAIGMLRFAGYDLRRLQKRMPLVDIRRIHGAMKMLSVSFFAHAYIVAKTMQDETV